MNSSEEERSSSPKPDLVGNTAADSGCYGTSETILPKQIPEGQSVIQPPVESTLKIYTCAGNEKVTESQCPASAPNQSPVHCPNFLSVKEAFESTSECPINGSFQSDSSDAACLTTSTHSDAPTTPDEDADGACENRSLIDPESELGISQANDDLSVAFEFEDAAGNYYPADWSRSPSLIAYCEKDYQSGDPRASQENYLRGCLWSPDGSCILTNSRDNTLRLFNLPSALLSSETIGQGTTDVEEMRAVLTMREIELVYNCVWYPAMNSSDPATCCFASTARRNPIRLWDAFTGAVRATYRPMNHLGDPISAYSVAFSTDCQRLYAGFNRFIHVFDVTRPGRDSVRRPRLGKKPVQGGMISCLAVPKHHTRQMYATGSYNGTVGVYAEPGNLIARMTATPAGVTQVLFASRLGNEYGAPWYLAAGSRMDSRIFLWDARRVDQPLLVVHRRVENHQRFQFDIDPSEMFLFTGSQTGTVCVYELSTCLEDYASNLLSKPSVCWRAHSDCAHGLSVHPSLPVLATTSGQRRIPPPLFRKTKQSRRDNEGNDDVPNSGSSAVCSSSSDDDVRSSGSAEANLTDDEASLMVPTDFVDLLSTKDVKSNLNSLPFSKQLTRLPRENRLSLWLFPSRGDSCTA
ncbi:unnamed protein product [Calicophoron daubneyi]|uniref:WD repeat-containing protein 79 n=1 Tax=Calicophoron daubneyi TaxID=300641 RepID=A0AAV2TLS4_CALDB